MTRYVVEALLAAVVMVAAIIRSHRTYLSPPPAPHRRHHRSDVELLSPKVLEGMVARRDSPDSETWLLLLNAVGTADSLDKAVALMERSRAEGNGSEVRTVAPCSDTLSLSRARVSLVAGWRVYWPSQALRWGVLFPCGRSWDGSLPLLRTEMV